MVTRCLALVALLLAAPIHAVDMAAWLKQRAISLEDDRNVRLMLPWFSDAAVVGLGDVTHGSHEPMAIKAELIPLLVTELGFRTIAFEGPFAQFERLNNYVMSGNGDPGKALENADYFFWDTHEVLGVIEWAREQNARGLQPPIEIVGIDTAAAYASRDAAMAENIARLVDRASSGVIVWGHNEHLGKTNYDVGDGSQKSAGRFLAERYGRRYIAVATIALEGSLWMYNEHLMLREMSPASPDDYATIFASAGMEAMAVSLAPPLPRELTRPRRIRIAGSVGVTTSALLQDLPARFDAVIYFETVTPSLLRHFPTLEW
jgi:erythromycin esterase-like protein